MPTPPATPDTYPDLTGLQACRDSGHVWVPILTLASLVPTYKTTRELVGCERCGVVRWRAK